MEIDKIVMKVFHPEVEGGDYVRQLVERVEHNLNVFPARKQLLKALRFVTGDNDGLVYAKFLQ